MDFVNSVIRETTPLRDIVAITNALAKYGLYTFRTKEELEDVRQWFIDIAICTVLQDESGAGKVTYYQFSRNVLDRITVDFGGSGGSSGTAITVSAGTNVSVIHSGSNYAVSATVPITNVTGTGLATVSKTGTVANVFVEDPNTFIVVPAILSGSNNGLATANIDLSVGLNFYVTNQSLIGTGANTNVDLQFLFSNYPANVSKVRIFVDNCSVGPPPPPATIVFHGISDDATLSTLNQKSYVMGGVNTHLVLECYPRIEENLIVYTIISEYNMATLTRQLTP